MYLCRIMEIFPTQYSLLSTEGLNSYLSAKYGLGNTTCRLLIHNVSDTYLLETKDDDSKYIFKVYRNAHRSYDEINGEIELLTILKDKDAKVSIPLKDLDGRYIQLFNVGEGVKRGVMFSFAQGKIANPLTEEHIKIIGHEIAVIHNITANLALSYERKSYDVDTLLTYPVNVLKTAFKDLPEEYEYLKEVSERVAVKIRQFDLSQFSYGYCHYDFLPKNFHFTEDNQITFFDFDFAGKGLLANDIASFYVFFFIEVFATKRYTQEEADRLFAVFIKVYREVRPFSDDELKSIPYLGFAFWIFYLGFQYENFEDWSNMFFGPNFLRERIRLLKQWDEWYIHE
jgi:Ser/Thr protein kinase RdoA (MazF antagonist)